MTAISGDGQETDPQENQDSTRAEQVQAEDNESSQQEMTEFGSVRLTVIEQAASKKSRKKIRKKLEILPEPTTGSRSGEDLTGGDVVGLTLYSTLYAGPIAGAGVALGGTMALAFNAVKNQFKSSRNRSQVKPAVKSVSRVLSAENPENQITDALLLSTRRKNAAELLIPSSSNRAADSMYHLTVEVRKLDLYQIRSREKLARLWISTQAKLESTIPEEPAKEMSFCHGSDSLVLEDLAKDPTRLKKLLSDAYAALSERILSEYFRLSAEQNTRNGWHYADEMCPKPIASMELAGGVYTGETRNGKPHGVGEIRYRNEGWTTLYRGTFVDGKEHGEGRCRYKAGGWGYCRYYKGKRT